MNGATQRRRGRPRNPRTRRVLAEALLREALREELLVMGGHRTPRGKTWMSRSIKDLQRRVAKEMGLSFSWAQKAWAQMRREALDALAGRLSANLHARPTMSRDELQALPNEMQAGWVEVDPSL
jgi:hypothetical protein